MKRKMNKFVLMLIFTLVDFTYGSGNSTESPGGVLKCYQCHGTFYTNTYKWISGKGCYFRNLKTSDYGMSCAADQICATESSPGVVSKTYVRRYCKTMYGQIPKHCEKNSDCVCRVDKYNYHCCTDLCNDNKSTSINSKFIHVLFPLLVPYMKCML